VRFTEWTRSGRLRKPSWRGLRPDQVPEDVGVEPEPRTVIEVDGRRLSVSNLDKVLYPDCGFTKADVISYYVHVAPCLLPHLRGRPLTMTRYPDGVTGKSFFEKHSARKAPSGPDRSACPGAILEVEPGSSNSSSSKISRLLSGSRTWPRSSFTCRSGALTPMAPTAWST